MSLTENNLQSFFLLLETTVDKLGIRNKPHLWYNSDETNMSSMSSSNRVLCSKGAKSVNKVVLDNDKQNYTIQTCCNAVGDFLPHYVLFKGKNIYNTWIENGHENCVFNCSPSGWMETDQFQVWFRQVFIENTKSLSEPKLLILDGHKSHITLEIVNLARENNIHIVCLPPHSTHILQPLDVAVFKPVKSAWRKIVHEHNKGDESAEKFRNIDKGEFTRLLKKLIQSGKAFLRSHAVAGFESTGIYPINRNAIAKEKLNLATTFQAATNSLTDSASRSANGFNSNELEEEENGNDSDDDEEVADESESDSEDAFHDGEDVVPSSTSDESDEDDISNYVTPKPVRSSERLKKYRNTTINFVNSFNSGN